MMESAHTTSDHEPRAAPTVARFALGQSVLLHLLFGGLILAGSLVVSNMPVDVYPDVELDEATIETFWPGASAEDVERLITDPIEDKITQIRGISRFVSDSKPGASLIRVKFREDLSVGALDTAFRQLSAAVDRVSHLPEDIEKPLVTRISLDELFPLLWVVVEDVGGVGEAALHDIVLQLTPVLRDVPGVAKVDDKLIRERELHVQVNRDRLREHNLTLDEVAAVLRQYNRNVPSGTLPDDRGEFSIRAIGEALTPDQLGQIAVRKQPSGSHVYLRDIADIDVGFARKRVFGRFNGHDCKALGIAKTAEADSRLVSERVNAAIAEFVDSLPPGIAVAACLDSSEIIRSRMRVLLTNLLSGIALVFATLWVIMGLRNAFLAILGIPFAFLCALMCMHVLGVTINAVSLFALVLCSGMIVDDAIVVLENIYRHIELHRDQHDATTRRRHLMSAIIDGTNEVMWPVISSSITTIVAFLPLLIMGGVTGKFFAIIPKTVTVLLLASLGECLLMLPVHYLTLGPRSGARWFGRRVVGEQADATLRKPRGGLIAVYDRLLAGMLRHRYLAPLPFLGLGFLASCMTPFLRVDLFPSDFQLVEVDIKAWDDASLDQTADAVRPIERLIVGLGPEYVQSVLSAFGIVATENMSMIWRNNIAQLHVQLVNKPDVVANSEKAAGLIRQTIQDHVDAHPELGIRSFKVWAPRDGPPFGKPVWIRIESPDLSIAKDLARQYLQRLRAMTGVHGASDSLDFGPRQINLRLREDVASSHGLTQQNLSTALRTANDGLVLSTFKDTHSGESLNVRLMLTSEFRQELTDLLDIHIRCPGGYLLRLGDICELDMSQGYAGIPHYNGKRAVSVTAQVDTDRTSAFRVNSEIAAEFKPLIAAMPRVRTVYGGEFEETVRSFESLKDAYFIAVALIYIVLATQFHSYFQPFIIIVTVPFACIGVIGGLLLNGYPFTIMTAIAMVGLAGVVVNDSIVLLDCVNMRRREGRHVAEALHMACKTRMRPVILTTVTTVLGLLPLAMGWGGRSKIWSPFASSFAWGLVFGTIITLFLVPAIYHIVHDITSFFHHRRKEA